MKPRALQFLAPALLELLAVLGDDLVRSVRRPRRAGPSSAAAWGRVPGRGARCATAASYRSMFLRIWAARALNPPTYGASWSTSPVSGSSV